MSYKRGADDVQMWTAKHNTLTSAMCWATCLKALRRRNLHVFVWCFVNGMPTLQGPKSIQIHSKKQIFTFYPTRRSLLTCTCTPWLLGERSIRRRSLRVGAVLLQVFAVGGKQAEAKSTNQHLRYIHSHGAFAPLLTSTGRQDDRMMRMMMMMMMVVVVILDVHDDGVGNG